MGSAADNVLCIVLLLHWAVANIYNKILNKSFWYPCLIGCQSWCARLNCAGLGSLAVLGCFQLFPAQVGKSPQSQGMFTPLPWSKSQLGRWGS